MPVRVLLGFAALLLAGAATLGAGTAWADTLVSNLGQSTGHGNTLGTDEFGQAFTTGSHAAGYTLSGIKLKFVTSSGTLHIPSNTDTLTVTVKDGFLGTVTTVATLTSPGTWTETSTFTAPPGTTLAANETYFVFVQGSGGSLESTTAGNEDDGAATGWSIANTGLTQPIGGSIDTLAEVIKIAVEGTLRAAPPSAPTNLRAKGVSATEISLRWVEPSENGGSDISGYKIEESSDGMNWTVLVANTNSITTNYQLTGLTSGHTRHYRVSAINGAGTGPVSNEAVGTAENSAPGISRPLVQAHDPSTVIVPLDEDIDTTSLPDKSAFTVKVEGNDRAVTSLAAYATNRGVRLGLASPVRPGEAVTVSYAKPTMNPLKDAAGNETASVTDVHVGNLLPAIRPDGPTDLTAEGVSTTRIDLSWSAPAYDGGADVTGYIIEVSTDRGIMWTDLVADTGTTDTAYSHTGLTAGAMRTYRVSSINAVSRSVPSNTATANAAQGSYTACSAASTRNRIWTANLTVGSSGFLLGFASNRGALSDTTFDLQGTTHTIDAVSDAGAAAFNFSLVSGLLSSTAGVVLHVGEDKYPLADAIPKPTAFTYSFTSNVPDWDDGDVVCLALTAVQATAPMNLTASATSATQIDLDWDPPDSGTPTGYKIEVSTDNGGTWSDLVADTSSTDTMYSDSSLTTSCSLRTYRVSAITADGTGPASNTAAAAPRAGPPGPAVVASGHTKLWSSTLGVGTNGANVGYYRERMGDDYGILSNPLFDYGGVTNRVISLNSSSSIFLFTMSGGGSDLRDITNATLHIGSEKFPFASGSGFGTVGHFWNPPLAPTWCPGDTVTVKLTQITPPTAPRNLRAKGSSTAQIDLLWDAPRRAGGSAVTGYKIEVSTDSGATWSDLVADTSSTATSYSHTGLSSGDTRHYRVSAINSAGTGPESNVASGSAMATAPAARFVELTSDPGADDTYAYYGTILVNPDVVEATVIFDGAVDVTGTPQLELDFDGTPKAADCAAHGTDTTRLVCSYTVAENDSAPDGIAIEADKLTLNGGTIKQSGSTTVDAVLTHGAVVIDSGHKVDGVRPTLVTTGDDAPKTSEDGTQVILTFSEDIGSVNVGSLDLRVGTTGSAHQQGATVTISGRTVTITLVPAFTIQHGQAVVLDLLLGAVQDIARNRNPSARNQTVTNKVPAPPGAITGVAITSDPGTDQNYATGDVIEVTATFDQAVTVTGTPRILVRLETASRGDRWAEYASGSGSAEIVFAYTVLATDESDNDGIRVGRLGQTNNVDLNGGTVTVVAIGENATLSYDFLASDSGHRVNWARPSLSSAETSTDGARIILTFNEPLVFNTPPNTSSFTVKVDGTAVALSGTRAAVSGSVVTLTLATALTSATQAVTVSYADPTTGDDEGHLVQDLAGNDAASFTDQAVTNRFATAEWALTLTDSNGDAVTELTEGGLSATVTVSITNNVPFNSDQTVTIQWAGIDLGASVIHGASNATTVTVPMQQLSGTLVINAPQDGNNRYQPPLTQALTATHGGTEIDSIDLTFVDDEEPPVLTLSIDQSGITTFRITEGETFALGAAVSRPYASPLSDVTIAKATGNTAKLDPSDFNSATGDVTAPFFPGNLASIKTIGTLDGSTPGDGGQVVFTVPTDDPLSTAGTTPSSVTLTILDNDAAPTAPRNLTSSPDDGSVTLTWQRPTSYETTQLTGYELKVTPGVGIFTSFADISGSDAGTTSCEVTGLTNNTAYTFELKAKNDHGSSPAVSVTDTPRNAGVFAADTASVTEGGSATIKIVPEGAPFGTTKTVTVVVASPDVRDRARAGSDFDVSAGGETKTPADRPFNRLRFTGTQPHYEIDLSPTDIDMTLTVAAVDDRVSECREEIFLYAYTDYGTSNERRITQYPNKYVARNVFIEDDDNRAKLTSTIVDSRTVTLTFDQEMRLVEEPDDPDDPGYKPNPPHNYFTLFEAKSPGVAPPDDSNSGQENFFKSAYGTLARTFALSGRHVTLTFPHAVDTTHGAWVRYNQSGRYAPLGKPRYGRCGHAVSGASWKLTNSAGGTVTAPLPQLSVSADREGTEGTHADIPFTVRLDPASTETVVVDYRTVERSAKAGEDFTATSGTLTFAPGDIAKTVRVPIIDDAVPDDGETFLLDIFDASGATFAGGSAASFATGTIRNTEAGEQPETPANTLTASFTNVPAEHGGAGESNRFTFDLAFSENLEVSYKTLRDHAFAVTGGDVKKARRKVQGSNRTWTITVEPDGWGDVSLTLPGGRACSASGAVCTADGRQLSNSPSATVQGPAALSVADASATEGSDATLDFAVSLDRASTLTVTVDYATSDGTATAGDDYTATSGTLTFAPGDVAKTVPVPILDDVHDDGGETFTLTLSNASNARIADGTATGTIENSDPIPKAWLARFGRTVADHVVDAIGERLKGSPGGGSQVTLGGQKIPLDGTAKDASADGAAAGGKARDALAAFADRVSGGGAGDGIAWARRGVAGGEDAAKGRESRGLTERELLLGSSFLLAAGGDGANASGLAWTAWGRAAASSFDGNADGLSLDGDVTTFTLGADAARGRWLGGVALAHSTGEGGFRDHAEGDHAGRGSGTLESTLTSVHPYLRFAVSERLSTWGILGYGTGDLTLAVDASGETWKTDTEMWMAAAGARGVLLSAEDHDGFELAARGDARIVRMSSDAATGAGEAEPLRAAEAETSRLRLILEGSHRIELAGGQTLTPSLEVGLRQDGGDAETGTGIEVGGGIAWSDPALGLTASAKARGLLAHRESDYTEWGASGSVRIDPGASGRGLSLTLAPAWGADSGNAERLWGLSDARGLAANDGVEPAGRLDAEAGWGFGAFGSRGLMTPFAGLALSEAGERTWRTGVRWTLGPDLSFGVEGRLREAANDNAGEHGIGFKLTARW